MNKDNIVKAGRPFLDLVQLCYRANRPLLVSGMPGIGKSEMLEAAAKEMGVGYNCRDLSLMEPPDLIGLPVKNGKTTKYLPPDFLPVGGCGLLVFEELNRCERYMRGPCLQLLTARVLNDYRLPPGWLPMAAINPDNSGFEVSELDLAMTSRFVTVTLVPDREAWVDWATENGVHQAVVDYVDGDTTAFDQPESNPRAYKYASNILTAYEKHKLEPAATMVALEGLLGRVRASGIWKTIGGARRGLSPTEILKGYSQHQSRFQSWIKAGQLDLVKASLDQLRKKLQAKPEFDRMKRSPQQWSNFGKFLGDLPGDFREVAEEFFTGWGFPLPQLPTRRRRKQ